MAGYNAEYTRTTKNFVFLDAKKATIADNKSITWGPYKLQKVTAKGAGGGAKKPAATPPTDDEKAETLAARFKELASKIADQTQTQESHSEAVKAFENLSKTKGAKAPEFKAKYTVSTKDRTITATTPAPTKFGAEVKRYNFACWFYTGPEKEDNEKSLTEIKELASHEIGADLHCHGTTTTLTHNATSKCFHDSLVDATAFGGIPGMESYESDDEAEAAPKADDEAEAAQKADDEAEAAPKADDEAEAVKEAAPKKKKKGGVAKAAPRAAAEAVVHVNVDVDFAGFDTFNPKCMIAYMQGQPQSQPAGPGPSQPAGPSNHVFYTIKAVSVDGGASLNVANVTQEASSAQEAPNAPAAAPRLPESLKGIGAFGSYKKFRERGLDFYRRMYLPNVLCDARVTDSMEYLFSRICTTEISYYNAASIIQVLMMGTIVYDACHTTEGDEPASCVSLKFYTEKRPAKVIVPPALDTSKPAQPPTLEGSVFGSPTITDLVAELSEIAITELDTGPFDKKKVKTIAEKIYKIDAGKYSIDLASISSAVLAISRSTSYDKSTRIQVKQGAKEEIQPDYARPEYMYARFFPDPENICLVYMTKKQADAEVSRVVVKLNADGPTWTFATPTETGLTLAIPAVANTELEVVLQVDDVKRSLHLAQKNTVSAEKANKFKTTGIQWTIFDKNSFAVKPGASNNDKRNINRALHIARAWKRRASTGQQSPVQTQAVAIVSELLAPTAAAGLAVVVEAFGRARPRASGISGMSRFV